MLSIKVIPAASKTHRHCVYNTDMLCCRGFGININKNVALFARWSFVLFLFFPAQGFMLTQRSHVTGSVTQRNDFIKHALLRHISQPVSTIYFSTCK